MNRRSPATRPSRRRFVVVLVYAIAVYALSSGVYFFSWYEIWNHRTGPTLITNAIALVPLMIFGVILDKREMQLEKRRGASTAHHGQTSD
jgi:TRAP-type uncharacterized transport system fused permease subunit